MGKVFIVWRSGAVIPNTSFSYRANVPAAARQKLNTALLTLVTTPEGRTVLTNSASYAVDALQPIDDKAYDALRKLVEAAAADLKSLLGK